MSLPKAIFSWSGGKDSAYCLNKVLSEKLYEVKYLLTTLSAEHNRISMHGVRESLLEKQSEEIGIPLLKIKVTGNTNVEYERQMNNTLLKVKADGIDNVIFGDIFLEDLRKYREENLSKIKMKAVFPLWKKDTYQLVNDFIGKKFKTVICCTNDNYLGKEWLGREIDTSFLFEIPGNVDPCGENGEFHTFCYAGPLFSNNIDFIKGEIIYKPLDIKMNNSNSFNQPKGFWYCDLLQ